MRRMNCGVPLYQSAIRLGGMVTGCPLHNYIPECYSFDEEVNMIDFIADVFAEIADFFINLWSDKIINKFTSKK